MATTKNLFAQFIQAKRINAGLSQRQVSDYLGYSTPQFISNWERGVSRPPMGTVKKLAMLYKIDADDMFDLILNSEIQALTRDLKRKFHGSR